MKTKIQALPGERAEAGNDKAALADLIDLLKEARTWNGQDIKAFEEITPNLKMLRARAKVLRAAVAIAGKLRGTPCAS